MRRTDLATINIVTYGKHLDRTGVSNRPRILLTNDDGIDSPFLHVLAEALTGHCELVVAAPMGERSWIGRAFSRHRDVHYAESTTLPCKAYALDGTPSDCVNIALAHLLKDQLPDAVCAGINVGFNCSMPLVLSSGTLAGAIEGAQWGLPAIAYSLMLEREVFQMLHRDPDNAHKDATVRDPLTAAAQHAAAMLKEILAQPHKPLTVHNINFPVGTCAETAVRQTRPARFQPGALFVPCSETAYRFQYNPAKETFPADSDLGCLAEGCISHSVLDFGSLAV